MELIERVAPSSAAVTILGESGTGKELVARAIHARSPRAERPSSRSTARRSRKELIESELFGHEKGAFTGAVGARKGAFEEADGGTLFLDEIGELPLDLQAKLLRALESGEIKRVGASRPTHVDVRVVAATNRDLLASAREGTFREDLYYRLCVVPLTLPPLRDRRGDIAALAEHFVRTVLAARADACGSRPRRSARLQTHPWPGNVRELRNVVHRALLLRRGTLIDEADSPFDPDPIAPGPGRERGRRAVRARSQAGGAARARRAADCRVGAATVQQQPRARRARARRRSLDALQAAQGLGHDPAGRAGPRTRYGRSPVP